MTSSSKATDLTPGIEAEKRRGQVRSRQAGARQRPREAEAAELPEKRRLPPTESRMSGGVFLQKVQAGEFFARQPLL
jgi:hypothetical protein